MELRFRKSTCRCLNRAAREVKNEEVTQELKLPDGMPDIGRVIAAWGQVVLRSKEWRGDTASVAGGVMVWVLYAPEDGSDARCVDTWLPFTVKWDVSEADREGTIRVTPLLRFADSRALSARKMMVRAGVALLGEMLYPAEIEVSTAEDVPEDVELLTNTYPVRLPRQAGEKTFLLDEELRIPGSVPVMERILSFTMQPEITDQKVMAGKVVFRGSGNLHLVYRCVEGRIRTWDFELPFSQFQELEAEPGEDARAAGSLAVTSLELDPGEEGRLRLKCGLVFQYVVSDRGLLELTQDAYSTGRQTGITMDYLRLPTVLEERQEVLSAEHQLPGQNGQPVDAVFLPDFPRQRRTAEGTVFEIPGLFQTVYYGEDGSLQSATARWEGQYDLGADEDSRIDVSVAPVGRPGAAMGGDGMDLRGQLRIGVSTTTDRGIPMVTALELGELQEPDPGRPSLILCRPEGEKLWELAKRCGSTVGAIRQANGLEEEPSEDRILLVPVS
ncbi:MAG: DUF3794 domain-containing protein [Oscillospiraceae bacterium]|nr:DUF3794 domain-containing protein [Oscillospiraceae bacterium]